MDQYTPFEEFVDTYEDNFFVSDTCSVTKKRRLDSSPISDIDGFIEEFLVDKVDSPLPAPVGSMETTPVRSPTPPPSAAPVEHVYEPQPPTVEPPRKLMRAPRNARKACEVCRDRGVSCTWMKSLDTCDRCIRDCARCYMGAGLNACRIQVRPVGGDFYKIVNACRRTLECCQMSLEEIREHPPIQPIRAPRRYQHLPFSIKGWPLNGWIVQ